MIGSFLAPWGWGGLHDLTGSFAAGVRLLPLMFFIAAGIVLWLRFAATREGARALAATPIA
jgi:hypothetical protein